MYSRISPLWNLRYFHLFFLSSISSNPSCISKGFYLSVELRLWRSVTAYWTSDLNRYYWLTETQFGVKGLKLSSSLWSSHNTGPQAHQLKTADRCLVAYVHWDTCSLNRPQFAILFLDEKEGGGLLRSAQLYISLFQVFV